MKLVYVGTHKKKKKTVGILKPRRTSVRDRRAEDRIRTYPDFWIGCEPGREEDDDDVRGRLDRLVS